MDCVRTDSSEDLLYDSSIEGDALAPLKQQDRFFTVTSNSDFTEYQKEHLRKFLLTDRTIELHAEHSVAGPSSKDSREEVGSKNSISS